MISSGLNITVLACPSPLKRLKSNSAAFCPIASVGCATTVNGGSEKRIEPAAAIGFL
jgi:hypothetical protein